MTNPQAPAAGVPVLLTPEMARDLLNVITPDRGPMPNVVAGTRWALNAIATGRAVVVPAPAAPMTEKNQGGS